MEFNELKIVAEKVTDYSNSRWVYLLVYSFVHEVSVKQETNDLFEAARMWTAFISHSFRRHHRV